MSRWSWSQSRPTIASLASEREGYLSVPSGRQSPVWCLNVPVWGPEVALEGPLSWVPVIQ